MYSVHAYSLMINDKTTHPNTADNNCIFLTLDLIFPHFIGHSFEITSHFLDGDLILTWPDICPYYDVSIQCDGHFQGVSRVYGTRFVVTNVLDCSLIDVVIRCTVNYRYIESERKQFYRKNHCS